MKARQVARTVGVSAAIATASAFTVLGFAGTAGATTYAASGSVLGTVAPISPDPTSNLPITPGTPYQSGQTIGITVPANTQPLVNGVSPGPILSGNIEIEECEAPFGALPSSASSCDLNTASQNTILVKSNGSFSSAYQVYSLPNQGIGDPSDSTIVCGNTPATECVLAYANVDSDFTQGVLFSTPFYVSPDVGNIPSSPGDGTPEAPFAIMLPLAGVGAIGGGIAIRRRRRSRAHAS